MEDSSITSLVCRNGKVYLHYIDPEDIECLNAQKNKSGYLLKVISISRGGHHWCYWTRRTAHVRAAVKEKLPDHRMWKFYDMLKRDMRDLGTSTNEIIIVSFTSNLFNVPTNFTPGSELIKNLSSFHSEQLSKWISNSDWLDELAPKKELEVAPVQAVVPAEDPPIDIDRDSDDEVDSDEDDY